MATTTHHIEHVDHIPAEDLITDPKRQRWILIAMIVALVAVIASVSGLNVAQQDLALDLGASQSQLLWVINGYTIALAALLLPIGAIGDRWGRKHDPARRPRRVRSRQRRRRALDDGGDAARSPE